MHKDFDNWNKIKKEIEKKPFRLFFKEREIWWCSIGINVGDEQNGKGNFSRRPVLVLKKFSNNMLVIIPLSTKIKDFGFYHQA